MAAADRTGTANHYRNRLPAAIGIALNPLFATAPPVSNASEIVKGYSLPVWVTAVAMAALRCLRGEPFVSPVSVQLPQESGPHGLPVQQAAPLGADTALAMGRCQPGDHLDLTRDLPIWVLAERLPRERGHPALQLLPGAGVGVHTESGRICASNFALDLLHRNLEPLVPGQAAVRLTLVFPTGARLAERTSNRAFGVVDGLALLGMGARVQPSAAPDQLAAARQRLANVVEARPHDPVVLVLGANGWDLARRHGLPEAAMVKVGNWIGPLLVEAAERRCHQVLLWGYHGKLLKLAGGIFHTHHHVADGRAAVLTAFAALEGVTGSKLEQLYRAPTVEAALNQLRHHDPGLSSRLEARLLAEVEQQARAYVARHGEHVPEVGVVVFDGHRQVRGTGPHGRCLLNMVQPPDLVGILP
ncbi:MAG: cobalt-precorrin-5B (C(1))-methyltransferase [Synechococcus sp. SB0668_bin_15]|nr:cobalt-precorrin-5B (C(1))-methyltransferase [Synechococcus sp. SB0668_bin_15]MYC48821.1 cobalt-precorrin-5B (C(1))-methyltransferase [Synechococcus sp. SB0662_bin_14]